MSHVDSISTPSSKGRNTLRLIHSIYLSVKIPNENMVNIVYIDITEACDIVQFRIVSGNCRQLALSTIFLLVIVYTVIDKYREAHVNSSTPQNMGYLECKETRF